MPDITASNSAIIKVDNASSWSDARGASTGTATEPNILGLKVATSSSPFDLYRAFIVFDTSAISVAPSSATLKLTAPIISPQQSFIIVQGGAGATGSTSAEYVDNDFNDVTTTAFSDAQTSGWSNSASNSITLNATARQAMADLDEFRIAVVTGKDYSNNGDAASTKSGPRFFSAATSTASNRPIISYVAGTAGDTPQEQRNKRRRRRSKGARGKGFSNKHVSVTTGGKTVANGFEEI